jgi:hypothetical protein
MGSTAETRCNEDAHHSLQQLINSETEEQKPQNKLGENDYTGRSNMVREMKETMKATVLLANLTPFWVTEKFHSHCET